MCIRDRNVEYNDNYKTLLKMIDQQGSDLNVEIRCEGHTDDEKLPANAEYPSNWELSSARASAVVRLLIGLQVDPTRLEAVGYGEFVPRDKNTAEIITTELIQKYNSTPQQKARNRRVEITFLAPRGGPVATSMEMAENEE